MNAHDLRERREFALDVLALECEAIEEIDRLQRIEKAARAVVRALKKFDEPPSKELTKLCELLRKGAS